MPEITFADWAKYNYTYDHFDLKNLTPQRYAVLWEEYCRAYFRRQYLVEQ